MDMETLIKSMFELVNEDGTNCLLMLFDMITEYNNRTGKMPNSNLPIFNEVESTAFFLIKLAEENKLDMNAILNWTANDGDTLFSKAAYLSESIASELLKKQVVVVTTVDNLFQIPPFRVS